MGNYMPISPKNFQNGLFITVVVMVFLFFAQKGYGSQHAFSEVLRIDNSMGLSSQKVYSLVEDELGAIWISTKSGVDRYNGRILLDRAGMDEFEQIRKSLRSLMKYIPRQKLRYDTDFADDILSVEWKESELENDDLKNYKAKAEYYVREHQDHMVIAKLKNNKPLTRADVDVLEEILWSELGTRKEYEAEYGEKPLGEFVREIVGLDMNAAKEAFAAFSEESGLDSRQMYFVNQIVEYIVHNGMLKDFSVLQEPPFTDQGSVAEIFTDLSVWMGIRQVIETINGNAVAA